VFSEIQYEDGHMDAVELRVLDSLSKAVTWSPDVIIYLRCAPETCFERMTSRARECETHVELSYLKKIHDKYESLMSSLASDPHIDVIVLDASAPMDRVLERVMEYINVRASIH
jgi:deoxyadenosine/deoxycytidine kinase